MKKKILVVDDDREMTMLIREMLRATGHDIFIVHDGLQAIQKSKEEEIDLILLDIRMPFFSGLFFCDAFKQRRETKNAPVIVISALSSDEDIKKAYERGASAYLKKPFESDELLKVIEKFLAD
ncbi:MAG TPA: response regulator [bacterium]|nr:response regulator [bacterium]